MALRSVSIFVFLLFSFTHAQARECTPPLPQPPHELALSMLGLADAENFACEGQTPALRLTYFTWSGSKKVLKVFFPQNGQAFIEIYEVGKAPAAVNLDAQDQASLRELLAESSYWQLDTGFWMMPIERDAAQQQQLLFVELSVPNATKLVWFDSKGFTSEPLVATMIALTRSDMGPFGGPPLAPSVVAAIAVPPVQPIAPAAEVATTMVPSEPSVEPVNLITRLAGTWAFTHGQQSGIRVITPRFGGLVAEISETFDDGKTRGIGLLSYDPTRNEYLETMIFNAAGAVGVLRGAPDKGGSRIRFTPAFEKGAPATRAVLTLASEEHFFFQMQQQAASGEWVTTSQADFHRTGDATR